MKMRKAVIGSALGLGMGAMAFTGMGTALAGPGVSFSGDGNEAVGFGDQNPGGAFASSTKTNNALAVSTGLSPVGALAVAQGTGNNVVAIDGVAITGPNTARNNVVTVAGGTILGADAHDNTVVNVAGVVSTNPAHPVQGAAPGALSLSVCGTSFSGQADHIKVSPGCVGSD